MSSLSALPNPVAIGELLTITVSGGDPNARVTVTLDNGVPPGAPGSEQESFSVQLDGNGEGNRDWTVPESGWGSIKINTAGADEIVAIVLT